MSIIAQKLPCGCIPGLHDCETAQALWAEVRQRHQEALTDDPAPGAWPAYHDAQAAYFAHHQDQEDNS